MIRKICGKKAARYLAIVLVYSLIFPFHVFSLPQGGNVVSGNASISGQGNLMNINQETNKAIINWKSFNIARPETVKFKQPNINSIALNRVTGGDPTSIYGQLSANGKIWLINTNGILVGPTGKIEVNSFMASTLNISNEDFLSGNYSFSQSLGQSLASILNQGTIKAADGGSVSLHAPGVGNEGMIVANLGKVHLGSGEHVVLNFAGNDLIGFDVNKGITGEVLDADGKPLQDAVSNIGTITANGGEVILKGRTAFDVVKSVVNNEGIIEAKSLESKNGVIKLDGGDQGLVMNSGTLDASGKEEGQKGGTIYALGSKVGFYKSSKVSVSGDKGGGKILIGGDYQGKNAKIRNAKRTYVSKDTKIEADAITEGDGGKVIVWADENTKFNGNISARGGEISGDGGFVEVSGKKYLDFNGKVDTLAPNGQTGKLLLDPDSITIVDDTGNADLDGNATLGDDITLSTQLDQTTDEPLAASIISNDAVVTLLGTTDLTLAADTNIDVTVSIDASAYTTEYFGLTLNAPTINLSSGVSILLNDAALDLDAGNVVLAGDVILNADVNGVGGGGAAILLDTVVGGTNNLTLDAGSAGAITVSGTISNLGTLTINSNTVGLDAVSVGGLIDIDAGDIDVNGAITASEITLTSSGTITLSADLSTDDLLGGYSADITIDGGGTTVLGAALITLTTDNGSDGTPGDVNLDNTILTAGAVGRDLVINAQAAGGSDQNGGDVNLGHFDNTGGFYLNDLTINTSATGSGNAGTLMLGLTTTSTTTSQILLDNDGSNTDPGDFSLIGNGNVVIAVNAGSQPQGFFIDTEQGNNEDGGNINLGSSIISGFDAVPVSPVGGRDLTLSTETDNGFNAGNITFGNVTNTGGGFYINDLFVSAGADSENDADSTGTKGVITTGTIINTDFSSSSDWGEVIIDGNWQLGATTTVTTIQSPGLYGAGAIDLGESTISASAADVDLILDLTSDFGANTNNGYSVRIGTLNNDGGNNVRNLT
ncbi:MAG: filamentous hemagglutinin N-terminal domain-containing protein, partial [Desulfobacterales bacterium]|nr:filamentous hemagglutinin N-terminal domain-containing protein [Desulfobacterales bacterium]